MIEPWSKFFWSDYDADEGLRVCSLAAQGLWMRMLCLMARATPKGELRIGGEPCSVTDLSRAVGESEETVAALLDELRRRGVFSATRAGVIYSRRLRKDAEISRKRAIAGKKGGMASLGKQSQIDGCLSKRQAKAEAKAKPQKPEARGSDTNVSGVPPAEVDPVKALFDAGVALLAQDGRTEKQARGIIASLRAARGDVEAFKLVEAARAKTDGAEWLMACVYRHRAGDDLLDQARRYERAA